MEVLAPYVSWVGNMLHQVAPALHTAVSTAAPVLPVPVATPAPIPVTLGLKVLLQPTAGGVIFRAASNTVATIYPVYASAKAIESKSTSDDVQWLTYWTLYGSLIIAEHVADQVLGKVPYYYHIKFAGLLWLQLPQTRGATYLYNRFYKPALVKYGPRIDSVLDKLKSILVTIYATHKVPIDATAALLLELRKQAAAGIAWLLSDDPAKKTGDGKEGTAKAHAA